MKPKLIGILFASLLAISCEKDTLITGSDEIGTKPFDLETFTKISHNVSFPVYLSQGSPAKVELTGNANILDYIELKVVGETLFLEFKDGYSFANIEMALRIEIPELTELKLTSSGDALFSTSFETPTLSVLSQSSGNVLGLEPVLCQQFSLESQKTGDIDLTVQTNGLISKSDGTAQIQLKGSAANADLHLKGASDFKGFAFQCDDITIKHESTGNAEVFASKTLNGQIGSTGDLIVKGNAQVDVEVTGTGKVILLD